ncbi:MAG: hypothetical protein AB9880_11985 [Christensenellales bacterium]
MNGIRRAVALLLALALGMLLLPAGAQTELAGTWQDNGVLGTTLLILGRWNNYMIWKSYAENIETGTWSLDGAYLVLSPYGGASTWWRCSLAAGRLSLYQEQLGLAFNFAPLTLPVPAGLLGIWDGEDDQGEYQVTFSEQGEFEQFYLDDFDYDEGNFIANETGIALCFSDGYPLQLSYQITADQTGRELELEDSATGELFARLTMPAPAPEVTEALPPPTGAPTAQPLPTGEIATAALQLTLTTAIPLAPSPTPEEIVQPLPTVTPQAPAAGEARFLAALAGTWQGQEGSGTTLLTLGENGDIEAWREASPENTKLYHGSFSADGSRITRRLDDGSLTVWRYLLVGDTLLLTDEGLSSPVTYRRLAPR